MAAEPAAAAELENGSRCLGEGRWMEARDSFRRALLEADSPKAYEGLGTALWWLGEVPEALRCWEAAYARLLRGSEPMEAVSVAVGISLVYGANFGNRAVANGWAARASRLVEGLDAPALEGWVLVAKSACSDDPAQRQLWSRRVLELARCSADRDLELCGLSSLGSALIDTGQVQEGAALLDEALAASLGGEVESLDTVVFTSCLLMQCCYRCADFSRVVQWSHVIETTFVGRYGCPYVHATCRTHYGAVLVAIGDWSRAEQELEAARQLAGPGLPAVQAEVASHLAELRLAQRRFDEALDLLGGFEDQPVAIPVLAAVHLARGEASLAAALVRRRLMAPGSRHLQDARLRELLGEAALATGSDDEALGEGRYLVQLGAKTNCGLIAARGERLLGKVLATEGDVSSARQHLTAALAEFLRLELIWEAARTRVALADVLVGVEPELARAEARSAWRVFEDLGAEADAEAAETWLRGHGGVPLRRDEPTGLSALTGREREVLVLLRDGLSNPEVAERLYASRRTIEHHVASILSKLGVRNRTEAAAVAIRHEERLQRK